jgi:ribosome-binding protein aMBF1 (putative translation factor)
VFSFFPSRNVDRDYFWISKENGTDSGGRDREGGATEKALVEVSQPLRGIAEGKRKHFEGVGPMKQTIKRDTHREFVGRRARKSETYRKTFARSLHQIDLALLVREMREDAGLTQTDLAKKVGTTQSAIARLEDAEYTGHSLAMLERIAAVCGVALRLHAEKKPNFDRQVALA